MPFSRTIVFMSSYLQGEPVAAGGRCPAAASPQGGFRFKDARRTFRPTMTSKDILHWRGCGGCLTFVIPHHIALMITVTGAAAVTAPVTFSGFGQGASCCNSRNSRHAEMTPIQRFAKVAEDKVG